MLGTMWNVAYGGLLVAYGVVDRIRTGRKRSDLRTRRGDVAVPPTDGRPRVLIHGVSVGEVNAAAPLVEALTSHRDSVAVVVSASTATGFEQATERYEGTAPVVRFPLDFTWTVERFLDRVDPQGVVLMEQELWPGFLRGCRRRGVPVLLVNARMSASSFAWYSRLRFLSRRLLRNLSLVVCQSESYRRQYEAVGVPSHRTAVVGSLKWDAIRISDDAGRADALAREFGIDRNRPLIVAGSTGPGEEARLIEGKPDGVQLLLAPRRPERWDEVARLRPGMPRRSQGPAPGNDQSRDVFLLDTLGELTDAYRLADAVFVGRSLIPQGGSNPLEAVGLGKATVTGPHYDNFRDVVDTLADCGGLVVSPDPMSVMRDWLDNPDTRRAVAAAGLEAVLRNQGTAARTAERILASLAVRRPGGV